MSTPNLDLPSMSSNMMQPSVPYNEAMKILDVLAQAGIEGTASAPPSTTEDDIGKTWRIGSSATGAWSGRDEDIALCTAAGLWQFFEAGTQVKYFLDKSNGGFYKYDSGWVLAGGLGDAPADGKRYARQDEAWVEIPEGAGGDASDVDYDNSSSGLDAGNVQDAIDEVAQELSDLADEVANLPGARNSVTTLSSAAGAVTVNLNLGDYFKLALTENVTTLGFSNLPGSGRGASIIIWITQDGTPRTVTWPASFRWAGGAPESVSTAAGAVDMLALTTGDNGTSWDATLSKARA